MMLKGFQFVGIDDMGADKLKKEKITVRLSGRFGAGEASYKHTLHSYLSMFQIYALLPSHTSSHSSGP